VDAAGAGLRFEEFRAFGVGPAEVGRHELHRFVVGAVLVQAAEHRFFVGEDLQAFGHVERGSDAVDRYCLDVRGLALTLHLQTERSQAGLAVRLPRVAVVAPPEEALLLADKHALAVMWGDQGFLGQ